MPSRVERKERKLHILCSYDDYSFLTTNTKLENYKHACSFKHLLKKIIYVKLGLGYR